MTDEEKQIFEEWFEEKKEKCEVYGNGDDFWVDDEIKKFCLMGYGQGLKAGRPQWHNLRKDPNDLPKGNNPVLVIIDYLALGKEYAIRENLKEDNKGVIAWCEIPTFDKE